MQRNSKPIPWRPRGLSDTLEASNTFAGAMSSLQNIIPNPTTKGLWQCRPAALERVNFATSGGGFSSGFSSGFQIGFSSPPIGNLSALKIVGNYAYGMVATGRFAGHDEPFCYNLLTGVFIAISGVTNGNTPSSPVSTGAWTPPTMALIGPSLIVTHPGFNGIGTNFVGIINIANPNAPSWNTSNLTGGMITFSVVPSAVYQFNNRAYYIHNLISQPAVIFSDALAPLNCTNANQVLTFGDTVLLTALGGLPLQNQLGGIIQSLIVFKGVQNIYQVTGDAATSNLTINSLNIVTGTLAPNTVVNTPKGLAFVSPDGVRQIDFFAHVSDPIGIDGNGVTVPFIYSVVPSRMAAACGGNVLRISVQNGNVAGSPNQEYWYDVARQIWTGPHTLPMALIAPYNNSFIGQPIVVPGSLWQSDAVQSGTSTFVENGTQMTWSYTTPLLPDTEQMTNNAMTETLLDVALVTGIPNVAVNAIDEFGAVQNSVSLMSPVLAGTVWGQFTWGQSPWSGAPSALAPYQLPWTAPIVFTRLQLQATGQSAGALTLGAWHLRYQILRQFTNQAAA
jgi:hypothetical protein